MSWFKPKFGVKGREKYSFKAVEGEQKLQNSTTSQQETLRKLCQPYD
jgi:hypothetical protein